MSQPRISNEQNPSRRSDFKGLMENLEENYNKLNLENQKLNKKISSLDKEIVQYKEKIGTLETENFTYKNELIRYQHEIEPKYNEKIKNMEIQYNNNMAKYKQEVEAFYNNIIAGLKAEADNSNRVLIEAIERLNRRLENPNLFNQPILGDGLSNNCSSEEDTVQLSIDINSLQCKIKDYVTTLKGDIKIDNDKIQGLYGKYNLNTQNLTDKILMKAVLQRYVLENGFKFVNDYLEIKDDDDPNSPNNQEKYIIYYTNKLIDLLDKFYNSRFKQNNNMVDDISTKIRQQVYGILDDDKRKTAENIAENLIKDIVRIFKFRLLIQEPKCEVHWLKNNAKIVMNHQWDGDYPNDYIMGICYFPLTGIESDEVYVQPNSYPPPLPPKPLIGNSPRNSIEKPSPVPQIPSSDDKKIVDFTRGARPCFTKKKGKGKGKDREQ
ncbi:17535_t:CDS:2 [Entrophospora sp. SA101]|nr:15015_t:CDS:2 [Entrophospora sp. SA101]CAJ0896482.1 5199_t:CDS:2 [Entrophospora sp. SA101]CAJ0915664.1 17535_t:CDS:2 [Entrophospora sp. SA101]